MLYTDIIINFINDFFANKNKENSNAQNEENNNNLNIKGQWGSGKTMEWQFVISSNIKAIKYNHNLMIMFFDGTVYEYYGVPKKIFLEFQHSKSYGTFFSKKIRYKYSYKKII